MNLVGVLFTIGFCLLMGSIIYTSLVSASRVAEYIESEEDDYDMDENNIYKEQLKRIKKHIEKKTLSSWQADMGMSSDRSDRLMTETVVELQVIESMIDEVMTYEDYE